MAIQAPKNAKIDSLTFVVRITVLVICYVSDNCILDSIVERNRNITIFSRLSNFRSYKIISKNLRRRRTCAVSMVSFLY